MKPNVLLATILLATPCIAMADPNLLANSGAFKPKITISESSSDKLVRYYKLEPDPANPGDSWSDDNGNGIRESGEWTDDNGNGRYDAPKYTRIYRYAVETTVRTSAKITANLSITDAEGNPVVNLNSADSINTGTTVGLTIGDFPFGSTLGEETSRGFYTTSGKDKNGNDYAPGDPKPIDASTVKALYNLGSDDGVTKTTGTLQFDWNKSTKVLNVTLTRVLTIKSDITGADGHPYDDAYGDFSEQRGMYSGRLRGKSFRTIAKFVNQPIPMSLTFGSARGERWLYANGVTKARYHNLARETLQAVTIIGAADTTGPVVKFNPAATADPDLLGVDFLGSVQDTGRPTYPDLAEAVSGRISSVGSPTRAPKLDLLINGVGVTDSEGRLVGGFPVPYTDALGELLRSQRTPGSPIIPSNDIYQAFTDTNEEGVLDSQGLGFFGGFAGLPFAANTLTLTATDLSGNVTVVTKQVKSTAIPELPEPFTP